MYTHYKNQPDFHFLFGSKMTDDFLTLYKNKMFILLFIAKLHKSHVIFNIFPYKVCIFQYKMSFSSFYLLETKYYNYLNLFLWGRN